jgi:hypothetical protein
MNKKGEENKVCGNCRWFLKYGGYCMVSFPSDRFVTTEKYFCPNYDFERPVDNVVRDIAECLRESGVSELIIRRCCYESQLRGSL